MGAAYTPTFQRQKGNKPPPSRTFEDAITLPNSPRPAKVQLHFEEAWWMNSVNMQPLEV